MPIESSGNPIVTHHVIRFKNVKFHYEQQVAEMKNIFFKNMIRWAIAVLCIAYIARYFWQQRAHVEVAFSLSPALILLVLLLLLIYNLLQSYRYRLVLEKCSGVLLPYWQWFRIFIMGIFLNTFIPQMGNVFRSIRLKKDHHVSYTQYVSAYLSFAWMDTCLNIAFATIVIIIIEPELQISGINAVLLLTGLTVVVTFFPILVLKGCRLINLKNRSMVWMHSKLSEIFEITVGNLRDRRYVLKVIIFGLIAFIQMCGTFYFCFSYFELQLTIPAMALFYSIFKLSTYLNVTPGNLGVRELAYGILSEQMNMGMAEGILVSAIFRIFANIVYFSLALPMGGLDLLRHREQYRIHDSENHSHSNC